MKATPVTVTQAVLAAAASAPTTIRAYRPAIWDRLAITMTSAAMIPQPPIQPVRGPNARAAQVKVMPQSGSALFSSRKANAMHSIGRNDTMSVPGLCTPTTATMRPSVAAMLYAGAVDETAITTLDSSPSAPARRPLSGGATGSAMVRVVRVVMMAYRLPPGAGCRALSVLYLNTILLYRF